MIYKEKKVRFKTDIDLMHKENSFLLNTRQKCDLELILNGGMSPLTGFMTQKDYISVLDNMRLSTGELFPIPIVLDIDQSYAEKLILGDKLHLLSKKGEYLAVLTIEDKWKPNLQEEAEKVYGTTDTHHYGVKYLFNSSSSWYVGGSLEKKNYHITLLFLNFI